MKYIVIKLGRHLRGVMKTSRPRFPSFIGLNPIVENQSISSFYTLSIGVASTIDAAAVAFGGNGEAVRVHSRKDVDTCAVDQPSDVLVLAVAGRQILDEVEQQFATSHLVTVDVAHVLHFGCQHIVLSGR